MQKKGQTVKGLDDHVRLKDDNVPVVQEKAGCCWGLAGSMIFYMDNRYLGKMME